jgi:hypothetical protein
MDQRMSALLRQADIPVPFVDDPALRTLPLPAFSVVGESVLLKNQYEPNRHVSPADFPDKTGGWAGRKPLERFWVPYPSVLRVRFLAFPRPAHSSFFRLSPSKHTI